MGERAGLMQFLRTVSLQPVEWLGLAMVAALVFVWPIPGSIALRNVLLVLAVAIWLVQAVRAREHRLRVPALRAPLLWYLGLTAWLLAGAFLVSVDPALSVKELKSQWLRSAVAGLLGWLLACWAMRPRFDPDKAKLCLLVLAGPIALQIVLTLGDTAWLWLDRDRLPGRASKLISGKFGISFNANVLFALVAADLVVRARRIPALLPLSLHALGWLIVAILACTWFLHARNGTLCLIAIASIAVALHVSRSGGRSRAWAVVLVLVLAAAAALALQSDRRWLDLEESVRLGWQTERHKAWLDPRVHPLPELQDGKPVQHSAYMRTAWMKESVIILAEHPLGVGFMRGAMGRAFQDKYGLGLGGHADNGLIDFSLGAGLPGTLLGAGLLLSLMRVGWRAYARGSSAVGLATFLVVLGYALRTLLDSTTRDNYLEQFLFMATLFATLSAANRGEPRDTAG